jgi:hypothetical protein
MADEDWAKELAQLVTVDRQRRRAIQRQADAEAAQAACFTSYAASKGTSAWDSSPMTAHSSTDDSMVFSPRLPPSRMSPEFGESQTYPCTDDGGVGVFSPVTSPRPDGVHVDLNVDYIVSESPDMRRAPNMFAGATPDATRSLFDEIPGDHEVFGEMPGAHMMFNDEEGTAYMFSGGIPDEGFQDGQAEGDKMEETIEVVDADTAKTIGKRKSQAGSAGTHHSK